MKKLTRSPAPAARFIARHSAIIALALFAAAALAILDDYGVSYDEQAQIRIGFTSLEYILGDENALIEGHHNRFYGVAFEVPLIVIERLLGLEDSRDIYLARHLITHLFFLAGGFFAWLLAHRLFGSRLVALIAMLLFLTHPRLYAHSFFNTKDLPFLSMFTISLYLTHRAFRRESVWAFALCGAGAGLLVNIRIMGLLLIPAVLGMLALDAIRGARREGWRGARREAACAGAFLTAFAAVFYAAWPLLWQDPMNLLETLGTLSQHPSHFPTLFRGELVQWPNVPWDFIPTWILITTPPAALILAALGIAYLARLCAARWRDAFENSTARFGLLAVGCLTMPVTAAIALNSNLYDDWRQMYFLYAPVCVLAAFGLRALADIPRPALRASAFAAAALGIALAVFQMVSVHPYQNEYFNSLVDKSEIGERWQIAYLGVSYKEAVEATLETQPNGRIAAIDIIDSHKMRRNIAFIPENDRRRLYLNPSFPSFVAVSGDQRWDIDPERDGRPVIWTREIYGVPLISILDARAESEAAHRAAYAAARASQADASGGGFDVYADGGSLTYVKDDCGEEDARGRFDLSVFPVDRGDLTKWARDAGLEYERLGFDFFERGSMLDGGCVVVRRLPAYPISHIETGQRTDGGELWSVRILLDRSYERYRRALASLAGEPAARSDFDVHLKDGALIYVREGCEESDARGRFFLSVFPADPRDLPQTARDAGLKHEPLNFDFHRHGAIFDGKCVIVRDLPGYPISRIETGQWTDDEGELWRARAEVGD